MQARRCHKEIKIKTAKAWVWVFTKFLWHMQADYVHLLSKNPENGARLSEKKQLEKQAWCRSITWKITTTNWAKTVHLNVPT